MEFRRTVENQGGGRGTTPSVPRRHLPGPSPMSFPLSSPLPAIGRLLHTAEQKAATAAKEAADAVSGGARDVFDDVIETIENDGYALYSLYRQLTDHVEVTNRGDVPPPPDAGGMK